MAVVPDTVKLESKKASGGGVEVRFCAKNMFFGPFFAVCRPFSRFFAHFRPLPSQKRQVTATFDMRPIGEEVKEHSVALVGVTEVGGSHFMAEPIVPADNGPVDPDAPARTNGTIHVSATYSVAADGSLTTSWSIDASDAMPAPIPWGFKSLPRVGVHLASTAAPPSATSRPAVEFYGRGPHEAYPDRKDGALLGRHAFASVEELHVPYMYPGESGGRADVRWLAIGESASSAASSSSSLAISTLGSPLQVNVSRYPLAAYAAASHDHEVKSYVPAESNVVHLHLDGAFMGVGGDDSWSPSVWEEFACHPGKYEFGFVMVAGEKAGAAEAEKRWLASSGG